MQTSRGDLFPTGRDFREMALHTEVGVLIHEAASKNILWANPAACRMFGFTLEELRPLKAHHMSSSEKQYRREVGVAWLQDAVNRGVSHKRWKYRAKDGRDFLTDAVATLVPFDDGPVVMVQFRAIDQEVGLEAELERTNDYLMRLMSYASAGILLLDDEGRVLDVSNMVSQLFGRYPDRVIGEPLEALAEVSIASGAAVDWRDAVEQVGVPIELRLKVDIDGQTRWLSGQAEKVDHDGMTSTLLAVRDITTRVEMQQAHDYQEANLQYLARYNAMGDMAMIIAHELGQPLAAAGNFLSGILTRLDSGRFTEQDIRYAVERARQQLGRSADIVSSVKRYVQRIESPATVSDLNAITEESLYFARLRAAERGVVVESELTSEPLRISGEQILIGQVIINYCFNAIDEMALVADGPRLVRVRTFADGDRACCAIEDWGRGLDQAHHQDVAEGRLPNSATGNRLLLAPFSAKQDGAGIGLVLSERIVERHDGEVTVADNDPCGTVITMRLPLAP
ncbi:PAS domain S-box protein [Enemella sp. A6]|uniref:PAS domain S-box protein n=1 Tax=Enemella sp. A6 TaxID=3440152 RepID=UPI003EB6D4A4